MAVQVCIYGESYLYQDSFKFIEIRMLYSKIQGVLSVTWPDFKIRSVCMAIFL